MLGRNEFALRQGFACGKTLVRRKSAAGQEAGRVVLLKHSGKSEISILTAPCTRKGHLLCRYPFLVGSAALVLIPYPCICPEQDTASAVSFFVFRDFCRKSQ